MTLWQRICAWFARPDPEDDDDSDFLSDGTQPVPRDMHTPGEATHKMMIKRFPSPGDWDALSDRRGVRNKE